MLQAGARRLSQPPVAHCYFADGALTYTCQLTVINICISLAASTQEKPRAGVPGLSQWNPSASPHS